MFIVRSDFWSVSLVVVFIAFCFCGRVAFLVEKKLRKKTTFGAIFYLFDRSKVYQTSLLDVMRPLSNYHPRGSVECCCFLFCCGGGFVFAVT